VAALELAAKSLALYAASANGATRRALDGDDAISHDDWVLKRLTWWASLKYGAQVMALSGGVALLF
jgi:hypothetical protein